jgi:hypothetical protein
MGCSLYLYKELPSRGRKAYGQSESTILDSPHLSLAPIRRELSRGFETGEVEVGEEQEALKTVLTSAPTLHYSGTFG